jgi:sugar lactone lactonase YvrE
MNKAIKISVICVIYCVLMVNDSFPISKGGVFTTIAGTGLYSYYYGTQDNVLAVTTQLGRPSGITIDSNNNVYIIDSEGLRVRKVDVSGIITTVDNTIESTGDHLKIAFDRNRNILTISERNVWKTDVLSGTKTLIAGGGTKIVDGVPATETDLYWLGGVAADQTGNIYISESGRNRIRKVDASGIITTIIGYEGSVTSNTLSSPRGITFDSLGNLYIADAFHHCIKRMDTTGTITTVAGTGIDGYSGDNGLATLAQLNRPEDVAVDSSGNIYIADTTNNCVRKVNSSGIITTVWGNFPGPQLAVDNEIINISYIKPSGIALDNRGNIYVALPEIHRVGMISKQVNLETNNFIIGNNVLGDMVSAAAKIMFRVNQPQEIKISVYDLRYRLIKELENKVFVPGDWQVYWDGSDKDENRVGPGVYLVNIKSNDIKGTKKVFVMR